MLVTHLIVGPAGLGKQLMGAEEFLVAPDKPLLSAPQSAPLEVPHKSPNLRILTKVQHVFDLVKFSPYYTS